MDPLNPIGPTGPAMPSRRVPPVDRLRRVTREGDKPRREPPERRDRDGREAPEEETGRDGEGHIDIRV